MWKADVEEEKERKKEEGREGSDKYFERQWALGITNDRKREGQLKEEAESYLPEKN